MPQLGNEYQLAQTLSTLQGQVRALATQAILLNASTGQDGGQGLSTDASGLHAYNSSGAQVNTIQTSDGTQVVFDASGNPQVRLGALLSSPGNYGAEIWNGSAWTQLVTGVSASWSSITGKPSTFPPTVPIAGSNITGTVPNATTAGSASTASDASGSSRAYNNNVGGTSFFAVWVGNDAGNNFGKNTSSARYKTGIREHRVDPKAVLKLEPVLYERPQNKVTEYGLVAEQVAEHVPELTQWFEGHIDNVRYDLLAVALLEVVKDQEHRLQALEGKTPPPTRKPPHKPAQDANNAPSTLPDPHPYTIEPR